MGLNRVPACTQPHQVGSDAAVKRLDSPALAVNALDERHDAVEGPQPLHVHVAADNLVRVRHAARHHLGVAVQVAFVKGKA
jgi:hypothetical protein